MSWLTCEFRKGLSDGQELRTMEVSLGGRGDAVVCSQARRYSAHGESFRRIDRRRKRLGTVDDVNGKPACQSRVLISFGLAFSGGKRGEAKPESRAACCGGVHGVSPAIAGASSSRQSGSGAPRRNSSSPACGQPQGRQDAAAYAL